MWHGARGREHAESWEASNAPHLLGESKQSERTSRVRNLGQGEGVRFIDIERAGPQSYLVRRQIIRLLDADSWIVLDYSRDSTARSTITNWTFYPDLLATSDPAQGRYRIVSQNSPWVLLCSFSGSDGVGAELVFGRETPFAGWVVNDRTPVRAQAIVVRQPSRDAWSLSTFTLSSAPPSTSIANGARMNKWLDGDHWAIAIPSASGEVTLTRKGEQLLVHRPGSPHADATLALVALDAPTAELREVQDAFRRASENSTKFRELFDYRIKVSYLLLMLFASQELVLFLMRHKLPRATRMLRFASWTFWISAGVWLSQVYFVIQQ